MTQKVVTINRNKLDSSKVVFPIGKIKGRNVYELMENEPDKLKWFVNQPFFREKHADIYNIIINGSNEIKDSKEHNEIVQLFYDSNFLLKLFLYQKKYKSKLEYDEYLIECYLNSNNNKIKEIISKYKSIYKHYLYAIDFCNEINPLYKKYKNFINKDKELFKDSYLNITDVKEFLDDIKCTLDILRKNYYEIKDKIKLIPNIICHNWDFNKKVKSEYLMNDIVLEDFTFTTQLDAHYPNVYKKDFVCSYKSRLELKAYGRIKFEIKPLVGEDYPEVLRQCKRQNTDVLIIKDFYCESTTLQVVREMFNPIEIILLEDITNIIL